MFTEKNYNLFELMCYSSLTLTLGLTAGIIIPLVNLEFFNDLFGYDKYDNIEKWNNLVLHTPLYEFYASSMHKFSREEKIYVNDKLMDGLDEIIELKRGNISFINNRIFNGSHNGYNKDLFIYETNLYFLKLKFMFFDYIINGISIGNDFSQYKTFYNKEDISYFLYKDDPDDSLSSNYRKMLNNHLRVGRYIRPLYED